LSTHSFLHDQQMVLQELTDVTETGQFNDKIKVEGFDDIEGGQWFSFSFRCAAGTSSAESRVFRASTDGKNPWMIVKQSKHTTTETALSFTYCSRIYEEFKQTTASFYQKYRVIYIIVSNRPCKEYELEEFYSQHTGAAVICKPNIDQYVSMGFGSFLIFDT